jgi:sterol desaturase/sphingolipid hydroxylase (fatty acid hydroxylase superfamily)
VRCRAGLAAENAVSAEYERLIVIAFYVPIVVAMVLETLAPRRALTRSTAQRWLHTAGLWLINATLAQTVLVASTLGAAALAADRGWGLLHALELPFAIAIAAGMVLLDLGGYLKHRLYHALPVLWQLHVVHHSDADMDVGTCLRHHPADYLLDGLLTAGVVLVLGAPIEAVLAYQVVTTIHNPLRHGNIALPPWLDTVLRPVIVTPDWHRVHHSALERETNSNYGVILTCWDRWLHTFRAQPERGHETMELGLEYFRDPSENRLLAMLTQPLRQPAARGRRTGERRGPVSARSG